MNLYGNNHLPYPASLHVSWSGKHVYLKNGILLRPPMFVVDWYNMMTNGIHSNLSALVLASVLDFHGHCLRFSSTGFVMHEIMFYNRIE